MNTYSCKENYYLWTHCNSFCHQCMIASWQPPQNPVSIRLVSFHTDSFFRLSNWQANMHPFTFYTYSIYTSFSGRQLYTLKSAGVLLLESVTLCSSSESVRVIQSARPWVNKLWISYSASVRNKEQAGSQELKRSQTLPKRCASISTKP